MITEDSLRNFFAVRCRVYAARARVPSPRPRFSRYHHYDIWHICRNDQHNLPYDDDRWIEVAW